MKSLTKYLNEQLTEGLLDSDFDIGDNDVIAGLVYDYVKLLTPSIGSRLGEIQGDNIIKFIKWGETFENAIKTTFEKVSKTVAKNEWMDSAFIIVRETGKRKDFTIWSIKNIPNNLWKCTYGVELGYSVTNWMSDYYKDALAMNRCNHMRIYHIPTELAIELITNLCNELQSKIA